MSFLKKLFIKSDKAPSITQNVIEDDDDQYAVSLNVQQDNNQVGKTGEDFFSLVFQLCGFTVEFLGDKAPDVDCFVSFKDSDNSGDIDIPYEFLVQVKSTGKFKKIGGTVNSGITKDEYNRLIKFHIPTYLARVDIDTQSIYIKGAVPMNTNYSRVATTQMLSLDLKNSRNVANSIASEVKRYWEQSKVGSFKKSYKSKYK